MLRRWFLMLLCAAIPLQGWAVTQVREARCPMAGEVLAQAAAFVAAQAAGAEAPPAADLPDCCNDAATAAATGQSCKTGGDCQVPTLAITCDLAPPPALKPAAQPPAMAASVVWPGMAPTVWRPPTRS